MDPITGLLANQAIQGVSRVLNNITSSDDSTTAQSVPEISSDFEGILKANLSPNSANAVDEEALYSAVVGERIYALKGEEGLKAYENALADAKSKNARSDGYVSVEDSTNEALAELVQSEVLTKAEKKDIKTSSFAAAQLDNNTSALFDGRGGANDNTVATLDMASAITKAREMIEKIQSGEVEPTAQDTSSENSVSSIDSAGETITPEGNTVDGAGGFVWKPESESNGNLVVLLGSEYSNNVASLIIKDSEGNVLEEGNATGLGNPDTGGEREHFRFNKSGGSYGDNLTVQVKLKSGEIIDYLINDGSQRYD